MTARMAPVLGDRKPMVGQQPDGPVLVERDAPGVATLRLNRPTGYNALSTEMVRSLLDALEEIGEDDTIKVVVLEAAGPNFCCGADHGEIRSDKEVDGVSRFYRLLSRLMISLTQIPQPVIAKVRGLAASEGCQLVAGCDLAIAGRTARFALPDLDAGLPCALPLVAIGRAIGGKRAMDMALTGAVVQADEALEMGLIGRLVADYDLDQACADMAARIAQRPRQAIAVGKEAYHRQADLPLAQAYEAACEVMARGSAGRGESKAKSVFQARRLDG